MIFKCQSNQGLAWWVRLQSSY